MLVIPFINSSKLLDFSFTRVGCRKLKEVRLYVCVGDAKIHCQIDILLYCRGTDTAVLYPEGNRYENSRRTESCPSLKGWQKIKGNFLKDLIYDKSSLNWIFIILNMFCMQIFWQAQLISKDWLLNYQLFFNILHLRFKFNLEL